MIKINLLPAHILERRRLRSVIVLVVAVLIIEGAVLFLWMNRVKAELADRTLELGYWQKQAGQVAEVDGKKGEIDGQTAGFAKWKIWTDGIDAYHQAWGQTLAEISKWIYEKVQISSLSPTQGAVAIDGKTESLATFRKAYLNLLRSPLYSNVSFTISGVGGGWVAPASSTGAPGVPAFAPPPPDVVRSVSDRANWNPLPIGVTFACALKPEYGGKLSPPPPPGVAGAPVAAGPAGPAPPPAAAAAGPAGPGAPGEPPPVMGQRPGQEE